MTIDEKVIDKLIDKLTRSEEDYVEAKRKLTEAKRLWTEAETEMVNASIHLDKVSEELRVYRSKVPSFELTQRDQEIETFRKEYPEVCEIARLRDEKRARDKDNEG